MSRCRVVVVCVLLSLAPLEAAEWYASPDGRRNAAGDRQHPIDLAAVLIARTLVRPGDTVWLLEGAYRHPDRRPGSPGFEVRLAGREDAPIQIRGKPGARVTIDGGLVVEAPSDYLWFRDLEVLVSENATRPREFRQPGSHPEDYDRPKGGVHAQDGRGLKFINLVVHDNAQGISAWVGAIDTEIYGCLIYDNGWRAPDRGHGHAIYAQNRQGVKRIADCIMTGGYSFTMHAYGSEQAYVDHFLVEGNLCYDAGRFLIGGDRPSRDIRVLDNFLYRVPMQIGYASGENEDCQVLRNVVLGAELRMTPCKRARQADNRVVEDPAALAEPLVFLRPNRYDPLRAHLAVFPVAGQRDIEVPCGGLLKPGNGYRLMDPKRFYGPPVAAGVVEGPTIRVPAPERFAAYVVLTQPAR